MGLSAVVFRPGYDDLDDEAGLAAEERIGNIAAIGYFREEFQGLLPPDSLILTKVIYSGSHCGDELHPSLMPELRRELAILQHSKEPDIFHFCEQMTRLANAASDQGMPILFV